MCYSKANPPPFPVFFGQGRGILLHFQRIGIQGWLGTLRLNWSGGSVYAAALAVAAMRTDKIPKRSAGWKHLLPPEGVSFPKGAYTSFFRLNRMAEPTAARKQTATAIPADTA